MSAAPVTQQSTAYVRSLRAHRAAGGAILATNFYNAETLLAVLRAARRIGREVILQTSPSTLRYLGVKLAASMARAAAAEVGVTAWLHLDHATEPEIIGQCIAAGYDSVMIDASRSPFAANVRATGEVVRQARAAGIAVEAELGCVPKPGQAEATEAELTAPEEAERFVEATGVDLLAVAIGTAHGFYRRAPRLDLARLEAIAAVVDVPLVLHGGSGIPPAGWRAAIGRGIAKVNFATEIKDTFMRTVRRTLQAGDEIDLRKTFPAAMDEVTDLVAEKMRVCAMKGNDA